MFFIFIRNFGIENSNNQAPINDLGFLNFLLISSLAGILGGLFYASIELLFDRPYFQKQSYARIIISKIIFFFFTVKIMMAVTLPVIKALGGSVLDSRSLIEVLWSKQYWANLCFFIIIAALISFVRMVNQKFGPGVLWNMFIGRYREPREEKRVFMFLDLQSSTSIAEQLGHLKYSSLIQDCFADLTSVVVKHKVEIYQYVGDEAVLSWPIENGLEDNHCIHAYFEYMDYLNEKSGYYRNKYGIQPVFKAGVHLGKVVVAEVGLIKREIAYHGDVLNTTARIQGRCNELKERLLISDQLIKSLNPDIRLRIQNLGKETLRGKLKSVTIHGVNRV